MRALSFILLILALLAGTANAAHVSITHEFDYGDTAAVTHGEFVEIALSAVVDSVEVPITIYGLDYQFQWYWPAENGTRYVSVPNPIYEGYLTRSEDIREDEGSVSITWIDSVADYGNLTSPIFLGLLNGTNDALNPGRIGWVDVGVTVRYYYYQDSAWHFDNAYGSRSIQVYSVNPLRGDVNNDGVVNLQDSQRMFELMTDGYSYNNHRYNLHDNHFFGRILFDFPTLTDVFLIDRWCRNHDDPLVAGLGIGEAMDQPQPGLVFVPATAWLLEGRLMAGTEGLVVAAYATLPNGQTWRTSAEVHNGQADLGPLPEGVSLEQVTVLARGINGVLEIDRGKPMGFVPVSVSLSQNYPNPFNPTTTIAFDMNRQGMVSLDVYNMLGQKVVSLLNEPRPAGHHLVTFDGAGLSSGVYFYRLRAAGREVTRQMQLMK